MQQWFSNENDINLIKTYKIKTQHGECLTTSTIHRKPFSLFSTTLRFVQNQQTFKNQIVKQKQFWEIMEE